MKKLILFLFCACCSVGMYAGIYYVDAAVAASGNGLTWASAKKTITEAITASSNTASTIHVAAGTYSETLTSPNTDGISYYGGYPSGNSGTDISNRNITSNITIIDGGSTRKGVNITKNNYVVDGFTIQNCSSGANSLGGAISLTNNSTIRNCIIKNSTIFTSNVKWGGAGVYMNSGTVQDCEIFGNSTQTLGGGAGVYIAGGTLQRCKVYNNTAGTICGGVLVGSKNNSTIDAALINNVVVANCLIYNNAKQGLYVSSIATNVKTVQLINNTVVNNALPVVFTDVATPTTMVSGSNNIFYGNTSNETFATGTAFTYNAIQAASTSGTGNIAITATDNTQTKFVSPTATKGIIADPTSNWNLQASSVCKDTGTGSGNGLTDVAGSTRVYNSVIDMGAYESQAVGGDVASTIAFTSSTIYKIYGDAASTPQTPTSNSGGTITYSSGNESAATVNASTGEVTIVGVGSAIITATQAAATGYLAGSATYTVVVAAKALTITATGPSKTYGTALTAGTSAANFTAGATGVGSEAVTSVTLTPDAAGLSVATTAGAAYVVTPSLATGTGGFDASNYNITYTAYNGTVAAAAADKTGGNIDALGLTDTELANTDITLTSGELVVNTGKTVRSITVNGGAKLTVPTGQTLTLTNLTLKSNDTSTATYKPEGTGALVVTGTTAVEQYLTYTRNYYVSSPVSNAVAPAGYTYYRRDESLSAAGWVAVSTGAGLTVGKGYTALPGTGASPITFTTQNGGTLNTGNITIPLTYTTEATSGKGYNLIGNPYPSHLSWTYAFTQAKKDTIESSIWYRTKAANGNAGGGWSFVTFNPTTAETVPSTINGGLIPPMQGFWVLAKQAGSIQFTNDMRSHQTGNPLKSPAAKSDYRKKLRLQVSNGTRADEALIVFDANASDSYDAYDSPKMMNNATDIADIYTVIDAKKLVINGMSSLKYNTEIPVGFSTLAAGDFSISANEFSNFETDAQVVLLDKELTKEFDLSKGASYNFSSGITAANANRFSLLFRAPSSPNNLNTVEKLNAQVFVNAANQITIVAPEKSNYAVYNAMGMLITAGNTTSNYQTSNIKLSAGVYMVAITVSGQSEIRKVIIR